MNKFKTSLSSKLYSMKIKFRVFSLLVVVCLTATTFGNYCSASAEIESNNTISTKNYITKISKDLKMVLDRSEEDDMIPVYIWTKDIDYTIVERKTAQTTGLSENSLMEKSNKLYEPLTASLASISNVLEEAVNAISAVKKSSKGFNASAEITKADTLSLMHNFFFTHKNELKQLSDSVDTYIGTRRDFAKEAYNMQNGSFAENYLKDEKIIFRSEYSPMIICEIPKKKVLYLDTLNEIDSLSLYKQIKFAGSGNIDIGIESIEGDYARDELNLDGSGVKVGEIDGARPDVQVPELIDTKIIKSGTAIKNNHATLIAAIITKMAPSAELYCTTADYFFANVEWLISSGVSVINFSGDILEEDEEGVLNAQKSYGFTSRWVDHVVFQHGVSWVNAAGNSKFDGYVVSPANAYNVIAVGGINDKGTAITSDDTYYKNTSNVTVNGLASKPDVVAPAEGFSLSNGFSDSGTSYAAPYVTGMITQIMTLYPTLKFRPDAIKAGVIASCDRKTTDEALGEITEKEGAGVVNAYRAVLALSGTNIKKTYYDTTEKTITFSYTPLTSGKSNVAISWLEVCTAPDYNHTSGGLSSYGFPNIDLYVYDSSGNEVGRSTSPHNSVEMVRFDAIAKNTYTVVIKRKSSDRLKIAIAHT